MFSSGSTTTGSTTIHENETLASISTPPDQVAATTPCLTVLFHPDVRRVGERALLHDLALGGSVELSRRYPLFAPPSGGAGRPLADRHISRKPIQFSISWPEGIAIASRGAPPFVVEGERVPERLTVPMQSVRAGVVIQLAGRVVLLLHMCAVGNDVPRHELVGDSAGIDDVRARITQVADLNVPVLVRGETGVGKERVARAIHDASGRRDGPWIAVNMAAISPTTAVSELFGHCKGAFTGAGTSHVGLFERADGGTLFLDEIGETPPNIQAMLLRVLETSEVLPVGADSPRKVDVRIIAATDANLEDAEQSGEFRSALLHRLSGYTLAVPPLRERRDDIARLTAHFLREALGETDQLDRLEQVPDGETGWFPASLMARLARHDWPGNVRQLRNVLRQLVISNRNAQAIRVDGVAAHILDAGPTRSPATRTSAVAAEPPTAPPRRRRRRQPDADEIVEALRANDWAIGPAAESLGIPRTTLYGLIDRYPQIQHTRDLSPELIAEASAACNGDVDAMAEHLGVSRRRLKIRMTNLGME